MIYLEVNIFIEVGLYDAYDLEFSSVLRSETAAAHAPSHSGSFTLVSSCFLDTSKCRLSGQVGE